MQSIKKTICVLLCAALFVAAASCAASDDNSERITVRLAAPRNNLIEDFDTNAYKLWLEEQTGLNIEMKWLPPENAEQIARQQLESGEGMPDAYVGFGGSGTRTLFANPEIQLYGEIGAIIPLNDLIEQYGTHTKALYAELPEYNIESFMTSADGNIYFMPGFSSSIITRFRQLMWVNKGWLDELGIDAPATTEEFRDMLLAFQDAYPDAIMMAGTEAHYGKQPYDWLFNAFIYNDTNNSRLLLESGEIGFAPTRDEWRDALVFMRELYEQGLYSPLSFTQDDQQLRQMASDRRDILGAFLSPGITLTVEQSSAGIMERYIGIAPVAGPDGVRLSTVFTPLPRPNGVITSACRHPEEVFKLFDLMLSEDAALMGRYGERSIDWDFADDGDVSIYGTPATIRIINQIWNTLQNKHLMQIVPYVSRPKFSGGVTWDGDTLDGEYINAQAAMHSAVYAPGEYIETLIFTLEEDTLIQQARADIEAYTNSAIIDFITGQRDVRSDAEWQAYIDGFDELGLDMFIETAQTAYYRMSNAG